MAELHSTLTAVHRPYAAVYADSTERLAATGFNRALGGGTVPFDSTDLYKKVLQLDDASEWVLTALTPTWVQVAGAGSLPNDSITNAKLANMAQATIKGRASGAGTGDPTDLTGTQATAILDAVVGDSGSGGTKGLVPAPGAGDAAAGKFLKADGTFAVPSGTGAETGANSDITSMDGLTGALENPTQVIFPEAAAPSTPGAAKVTLYAKADGLLYSKDDAGAETLVSGGAGGGSIAPLQIETANRIFQRNGTTAQEFLVAKTWTDATHYEAVRIRSDSSNCFIEAIHLNSSPPVLQIIAGTHLYLMSAGGSFNWHVRSDNGALESGGSNGILCGGTLRVGTEAGFRSSSGAQGNLMHVTDNNLSTTPGALSFKQPVIAKTSSPESVTADETGFVFTNAGAGGAMNFNLPAAQRGLTFTFYVDASQTITVTATNSHTIREGSTVGAANGNIASGATKGSMIKLTCFKDGEWVVEYRQLTWTIS